MGSAPSILSAPKALNKVTGWLGADQAQAGADRAAAAAGAAGMAQQQESQRQWGMNNTLANQAIRRTDEATVSGLAGLKRSIAMQDKNLQRQEQLISQIDPTIIEASQQALKLLRGETSSTQAPLQAQRAQQRQKLLNTLREQLGPGAETSTAGMQALNRFDSESSGLFAQNQQNSLTQMGNIGGQFNSMRPDMLGNIMGSQSLRSGMTDLYMNSANARMQKINAMSGSGAQMMGSSGAQYTADMLRGQNEQARGNANLGMFTKIAGIGAGAAFGGGGGAAAAGGGQINNTQAGTPYQNYNNVG